LIVNKFRSKYAYGAPDTDSRYKIITSEVELFIDNEKCNDKNLLLLDKRLMDKLGESNKPKSDLKKHSKRASQASKVSSEIGSQKSNKSAMLRAGLDICSQERPDVNSSYNKDRQNLAASYRSKDLNRSQIVSKEVDEWDCIIMNDVRRFEEEQKQLAKQKQELKKKVMDDLNAQLQEKKKLHKEEVEHEKELELERERVFEIQDRRRKEQELKKYAIISNTLCI